MSHLGFYVPDREKAEDFFCNTLGFLSEWKGGPEPGKVQWILMRTPEGDDAIELILSDNETPSKEELLFDNHICLEVINLENTLETLSKREFPDNVPVPGKLSLTKSKIRMINYALPDGTRFELMEEQPYDNIKAESL
jgi:catechol 2,3-dioxygenase-like lactoylglutathione lyase family enzyme